MRTMVLDQDKRPIDTRTKDIGQGANREPGSDRTTTCDYSSNKCDHRTTNEDRTEQQLRILRTRMIARSQDRITRGQGQTFFQSTDIRYRDVTS